MVAFAAPANAPNGPLVRRRTNRHDGEVLHGLGDIDTPAGRNEHLRVRERSEDAVVNVSFVEGELSGLGIPGNPFELSLRTECPHLHLRLAGQVFRVRATLGLDDVLDACAQIAHIVPSPFSGARDAKHAGESGEYEGCVDCLNGCVSCHLRFLCAYWHG